MHFDLVGGHRLPAGGHGITHLSGHDGLGILETVVHAQEGFHIGVKAVHRGIHGVEAVVVPALTVLGLVIDHAVLHLHLAGGEVALEVQHIVLRVPQAELHEAGQDHVLRGVGFIGQGNLVHFGVKAHGHEALLGGLQAVLFAGDDGIAHAVTAGILVQFGLNRLPSGVPDRAVVVNIEITAAVVHRHVVVPVAGDPAKARIPVEAIASGSVADDTEELLAAEIIDPGIRCARGIDDIFPCLVVEMAEFHGNSSSCMICPQNADFFQYNILIFPVQTFAEFSPGIPRSCTGSPKWSRHHGSR